MNIFMLILMVFTNAGETICYKNTKEKNSFFSCFNITFWSFIFSIIIFVVYAIIDGASIFSNFNWFDILIILGLAVLSIFNIISWHISSNNMPMSIAEGVSEIYIVFLTLFSWLIFGGAITVIQIVMIALVIVSCLGLSFIQKKEETKDYNLKKGFVFLTLWIIVAVIRGLIPGQLSSTGLHPSIYSLILNFLMLMMSLALIKIKKQNIKQSLQSIKDPFCIIIAICRNVGQIIIIYLATQINLGVIDAVSVLGLVLIAIYERFIMKEKLSWISYILLALITIGSFTLMLV